MQYRYATIEYIDMNQMVKIMKEYFPDGYFHYKTPYCSNWENVPCFYFFKDKETHVELTHGDLKVYFKNSYSSYTLEKMHIYGLLLFIKIWVIMKILNH